jgi:hypothetical protein
MEAAMDPEWQKQFRDRMHRFEARSSEHPGDIAVSIKIRVVSGCFHREHSPRAYDLIDLQMMKLPPRPELGFEEHESGPELLVYLAVATAGITLAKSVIDLITAIIKARAEGVKKGDKPADPLELIVRRVDKGDEFHEEIMLRVGHKDSVDEKMIKKQVDQALRKLVRKDDATEGSKKKRGRR